MKKTIYICDRCKETYEKTDRLHSMAIQGIFGHCQDFALQAYWSDEDNQVERRSHQVYELCPKCATNLVDWLSYFRMSLSE